MEPAEDPATEKARQKALYREAAEELQRGCYETGWRKYEARFALFLESFDLPQPRWQGQPLAGKSILVHREQGVGDEVMFASCLPDMLARAARCFISCDERLAGLYRRSFHGATILPCPAGSPGTERWRALEVDYQIPAGSVCQYLRSDLSMFPDHTGYLRPDPSARAAWRQRLDALGPGAKVGIAWHGGAYLHTLRHLPWDALRQILAIDNVRFVSLQHGPPERRRQVIRDTLGGQVHDFADMDPMQDLEGLATLTAALDAVVSVPNANVHLAGAVGTRVYMLHRPLWGCIWVVNQSMAPWYPSARILRRSGEAGWKPVVDALRSELPACSGRGAGG